MDDTTDTLAVSLFGEILTVDQLARNQLSKVLPKGMEISHFSVLNHLARTKSEKTPAQLAQLFHVTRGAMTNTVTKLEWAGYVHVRPDWDDARRKWVSISPAGTRARDVAYQAISPMLRGLVEDLGPDAVKEALPLLRALRDRMSGEPET
ncbi:MarR family winged helix-turn-helix transcriptional regulator [Pseudaestuariivita atlantica]|uniref:MarR family transcriptional regulator n=1 Tax=Pseudaestuariivita atlantica TaxID=1317121 RepID=A0A0L1JPL1_9RHOB|nr:MarR family transcriptional regulator [Pseudaestuariivita atlantica]KNG93671.1 MarR family transcriptional regulator [Pseudaestuariivita atlantica]